MTCDNVYANMSSLFDRVCATLAICLIILKTVSVVFNIKSAFVFMLMAKQVLFYS